MMIFRQLQVRPSSSPSAFSPSLSLALLDETDAVPPSQGLPAMPEHFETGLPQAYAWTLLSPVRLPLSFPSSFFASA